MIREAARDPIRIAREEDWLRLSAPGFDRRDPWELLAGNARRHGPARMILATRPAEPRGFAPELVMDVPLDRGTARSEYLEHAKSAFRGVPGARTPDAAAPEVSWSHLGVECGWPVVIRADGSMTVELDTPGLSAQARVAGTDGGLSLSVEVGHPNGASPRARQAMARFALLISGGIRMLCATASGDPAVIRFEARLIAPIAAGDLDLALAALSVGYRTAARELRALTDDTLAAVYLEHLTPEEAPCDSTKEAAFSCSM